MIHICTKIKLENYFYRLCHLQGDKVTAYRTNLDYRRRSGPAGRHSNTLRRFSFISVKRSMMRLRSLSRKARPKGKVGR